MGGRGACCGLEGRARGAGLVGSWGALEGGLAAGGCLALSLNLERRKESNWEESKSEHE